MARRDPKNRSTQLLILLARLIGKLPLGISWRIGEIVGWTLYRTRNRERRNVRINLALCFPELADQSREKMVEGSLHELGKTLMEGGPAWFWPLDKTFALIRDVEGQEVMDAAVARGKGVVALCPHLGSWEIGGLYLSRFGKTTIMYKAPKRAIAGALIVAARERSGANVVELSSGGLKEVYRALARGEIVGLLPDQVPKDGAGALAPFFGEPAETMLFVNRLARKTGASVVFGAALRLEADTAFRIVFKAAPDGIDAVDPVVAATALNKGVESLVVEAPEQYQWNYQRFPNYLPDGTKRYRGK